MQRESARARECIDHDNVEQDRMDEKQSVLFPKEANEVNVEKLGGLWKMALVVVFLLNASQAFGSIQSSVETEWKLIYELAQHGWWWWCFSPFH